MDMLGRSARGKDDTEEARLELREDTGLFWLFREGIAPNSVFRNTQSISVFLPRSVSQLDPDDAHKFASGTFGASVIGVMLVRGLVAGELFDADVFMVAISQVFCASGVAAIDTKWLAIGEAMAFESEFGDGVASRLGVNNNTLELAES
jgi:hypothetical protein